MHRTHVVFEGNVDTLPRINAILRWLKVYCLYNTGSGAISRITFSIHGERDE